jgi:hypothetical protein
MKGWLCARRLRASAELVREVTQRPHASEYSVQLIVEPRQSKLSPRCPLLVSQRCIGPGLREIPAWFLRRQRLPPRRADIPPSKEDVQTHRIGAFAHLDEGGDPRGRAFGDDAAFPVGGIGHDDRRLNALAQQPPPTGPPSWDGCVPAAT